MIHRHDLLVPVGDALGRLAGLAATTNLDGGRLVGVVSVGVGVDGCRLGGVVDGVVDGCRLGGVADGDVGILAATVLGTSFGATLGATLGMFGHVLLISDILYTPKA